MQRYVCFLKNKINLSKNDIFLFLNEIEWEVGYSQKYRPFRRFAPQRPAYYIDKPLRGFL